MNCIITVFRQNECRQKENENKADDVYYEYSICEVYLDNDGKLQAWTEKSSIALSGSTPDELICDLQYMLNDITKWKPVPFNSLQVGMSFERGEPFDYTEWQKDLFEDMTIEEIAREANKFGELMDKSIPPNSPPLIITSIELH